MCPNFARVSPARCSAKLDVNVVARGALLPGVQQQALLRGVCMPTLQHWAQERIPPVVQSILPVLRWRIPAGRAPPL